MQGKKLIRSVKRKKFSKELLEKLHIGDLLLYKNREGEYVVGWIVSVDLKLYDTFCAVQWSNGLGLTYMYIGDVLAFHEAYEIYRSEQGL